MYLPEEILGHHEDLRCRTKEDLKPLYEAVENRNIDELVLITDKGPHLRSREFQTRIRELDIFHERPIVNTPEENIYIESFYGILKRPEVYSKYHRSITHCRNSIVKFIDKYNNRRPYSSVVKIPPVVYHKKILNHLVSAIKFAA